jgi:hypothetical protein
LYFSDPYFDPSALLNHERCVKAAQYLFADNAWSHGSFDHMEEEETISNVEGEAVTKEDKDECIKEFNKQASPLCKIVGCGVCGVSIVTDKNVLSLLLSKLSMLALSKDKLDAHITKLANIKTYLDEYLPGTDASKVFTVFSVPLSSSSRVPSSSSTNSSSSSSESSTPPEVVYLDFAKDVEPGSYNYIDCLYLVFIYVYILVFYYYFLIVPPSPPAPCFIKKKHI